MTTPPAQSVENAIIDDVVSQLESIVPGSGTFYSTPRRVYRMYGNVMEVSQVPCIILTPLPSPHSHDCPNGTERMDLMLAITCVMDATSDGYLADDYEALDEAIRNMATDVKKALLADLKRGDRAIDTIIQSTDVFEAAQMNPIAAAEVQVHIPFRYLTADPTQAQ